MNLIMTTTDIIQALEDDKSYEEKIMIALQCTEVPSLNYFRAWVYQQITKGELLEALEATLTNR